MMYLEPGIKINAFSLKNVVEISVVTLLIWLLKMCFLTTLIKGCFLKLIFSYF